VGSVADEGHGAMEGVKAPRGDLHPRGAPAHAHISQRPLRCHHRIAHLGAKRTVRRGGQEGGQQGGQEGVEGMEAARGDLHS
jgi:hypothetical protein